MRTLLLFLFLPFVQPALPQGTWTLQQCLARAEERNLAVLNAALDAQLAGENKDRTYWDLLPDLNGVATHGYNYGRVIDRFTNTFATDRVRTNNFYLSSQLDLFRGLSKQNSIKQARFLLKYAEADGSLGMHNPAYVRDMLVKARDLIVNEPNWPLP